MTLSANGETFDEHPPPGEYKVCPLMDCRYKLLLPGPNDHLQAGQYLAGQASSPESLDKLVTAYWQVQAQRQEDLLHAHLKTHNLIDFERTRIKIIENAQRRANQLTKLADLVFRATATTEPERSG